MSSRRSRNFADERTEIFHGRAAADEFAFVVVGFLAQEVVDLDELGKFLRLAERDFDLLGGKRLDEVIKRTVLHALHGGFHGAEAGHDDGERALRAHLQFLEQLDAVAVRQPHVHENQIKVVAAERIAGDGQGRGGDDIKLLAAEKILQVGADNRVIFEDYDFLDGHGSGNGVAAVKAGHKIRLLRGGRRQLRGRN